MDANEEKKKEFNGNMEDDIDISKLEQELEDKISDWNFIEKEIEQIGNPDVLGETLVNVVWDQFLNQIAVKAGEDFIKENHGLTLDLRKEAHIQTSENFVEGKLATHNYISKDKLEHNYDRYKNVPHKQFRKEYVNPGMDATLKRAGEVKKQGIDTVTDIYTGRQIPTQTKLENGKNNPQAAQREHVNASAEMYKNPSLQMSYDDDELAGIINSPENLQGYTTAERNNRKSDKSADEMEERDKTKHWEKAKKRADEHTKKYEKAGEERLRKEGLQTQKEEAFRIGGKALRAVIMQLLAELIKEIISKLVRWLKEKKKTIESLIESVEDAIKSFVGKMKEHMINATSVLITTIVSAISESVVQTIKRVWMSLKQGWQVLKETVAYLKNPENKDVPNSIKLLEIGKIVMAGLSGIGGVALGEIIETGLRTIPMFNIEIPLIGSLANMMGIFMGTLVAGIVGAIVINLLDKATAQRRREIALENKIEKGNEVLTAQRKVRDATIDKTNRKIADVANDIKKRHEEATKFMKESVDEIFDDSENYDNQIDFDEIDSALDDLLD